MDDNLPYRTIITRQEANEVLVSTAGAVRAIPSWTLGRARPSEHLVHAANQQFGLETYCLWASDAIDSSLGAPSDPYAVLEALGTKNEAAKGTAWIRSADLLCNATLAPADRRAVSRALDMLKKNSADAWFARPGWLPELWQWVKGQIAPLGLAPTGRFRQINASPSFSLIRIETTGVAVWFKATGQPNVNELSITRALSFLFPRHLPRVLAVHPASNGWLSSEAPGVLLDSLTDSARWGRAAGALADLQVSSIGRTRELLAAQLKDLRIASLLERIDPFLWHMNELMAQQRKAAPPRLSRSEINAIGSQLKQACRVLEALDLPETLGHMDLSPANIVVSPHGCVFLDWAEGSVTHPFLSFEYLREHLLRSNGEPEALRELTRAYFDRWRSFCPREQLARSQERSPLVAVFAYAVSNDSWRGADLVDNPHLAKYFRSLTRRMYREALGLEERGVPCLA